nr:site-specific integrase [Bradyrhizobium sp. 1]
MASVRAYLEAEKSSNTRKGYATDWADFTAWCGQVSEDPLPALPAVVARYLAQLADGGRKSSTIQRRVAAIRSAHKAANFEPPTNSEGVKATMRLGHSKSDQEGRGTELPVPNGKKLRPVEALDAWLAAAKITSGPVFREVDRHGRVGAGGLSGRSIARIVKRAIEAAGLDEAVFSGHSMRAGFITSALDAGEDPLKVKGVSRHVKLDTLAIYDRRESDFENHAGGDFL